VVQVILGQFKRLFWMIG